MYAFNASIMILVIVLLEAADSLFTASFRFCVTLNVIVLLEVAIVLLCLYLYTEETLLVRTTVNATGCFCCAFSVEGSVQVVT